MLNNFSLSRDVHRLHKLATPIAVVECLKLAFPQANSNRNAYKTKTSSICPDVKVENLKQIGSWNEK